jgi:D-sedoheptulose 7-phosphate isomerase
MIIDFENIEEKCKKSFSSSEYDTLVRKIVDTKKIFVIGNGGLHFVASHMATDMTRLIKEKAVYSFDSVGFITSNSNDHGFDQAFVRWLETIALVEDPNNCLVIGLSCSGNSSNIIGALHWAEEKGMHTFMVSGQKSQILEEKIDEMFFNCENFHTVEVMCMMMFYDLIHRTGNHCPSISKEKKRMGDSYLRRLPSTDE